MASVGSRAAIRAGGGQLGSHLKFSHVKGRRGVQRRLSYPYSSSTRIAAYWQIPAQARADGEKIGGGELRDGRHLQRGERERLRGRAGRRRQRGQQPRVRRHRQRQQRRAAAGAPRARPLQQPRGRQQRAPGAARAALFQGFMSDLSAAAACACLFTLSACAYLFVLCTCSLRRQSRCRGSLLKGTARPALAQQQLCLGRQRGTSST